MGVVAAILAQVGHGSHNRISRIPNLDRAPLGTVCTAALGASRRQERAVDITRPTPHRRHHDAALRRQYWPPAACERRVASFLDLLCKPRIERLVAVPGVHFILPLSGQKAYHGGEQDDDDDN